MPILGLLILLAIIFFIWKMFVDGWLFKIILFFAGWFGLYVALMIFVAGADHVAVIVGGTSFTWASVIPTVICFLCLLCTKAD